LDDSRLGSRSGGTRKIERMNHDKHLKPGYRPSNF